MPKYHITKYWHTYDKVSSDHKKLRRNINVTIKLAAISQTSVQWIIKYYSLRKNPKLPKGIIVKNTHRSIYPLIMLLRNAEGGYLYLILKDIDVVLKKGIKRY